MLDACSALTAEELDRDLRTSHASVSGILRHIYYAERVWLKRVRANSRLPMIEIGDQWLFRDPSPEPGLPALKQSWPKLSEGLHQYARACRLVWGVAGGPLFRFKIVHR